MSEHQDMRAVFAALGRVRGASARPGQVTVAAEDLVVVVDFIAALERWYQAASADAAEQWATGGAIAGALTDFLSAADQGLLSHRSTQALNALIEQARSVLGVPPPASPPAARLRVV